jgi:hypothetical protein
MPNAASAVQVVLFYTSVFDADFGKFYLNFFNDPDIRPYCGVDFTPFRDKVKACKDLVTGSDLECWNRCFMGLRPSQYITPSDTATWPMSLPGETARPGPMP